ncbi:hypothetical protein DVK02_11540 [Halobellus sp. Atlit-31R]|nr:hypothetical protein DVK02_11540 [Halobellus sp. Atlit-31R]
MPDPDYSTNSNRRCERCGAAVSRQFVRVFGFDNTVHGCLNCLTRTQLAVGEAAMRDGGDTDDVARVRWPASGSP